MFCGSSLDQTDGIRRIYRNFFSEPRATALLHANFIVFAILACIYLRTKNERSVLVVVAQFTA